MKATISHVKITMSKEEAENLKKEIQSFFNQYSNDLSTFCGGDNADIESMLRERYPQVNALISVLRINVTDSPF